MNSRATARRQLEVEFDLIIGDDTLIAGFVSGREGLEVLRVRLRLILKVGLVTTAILRNDTPPVPGLKP